MTGYFDHLKTAPERSLRAVPDTPIDPARASRYATKALQAECENVAAAAEGTRNDTLNRAAFNISQLVAAGHVDRSDAWSALSSAARAAGLDDTEIGATLDSGFKAGTEQPRVVPELPDPPAATILGDTPTPAATEGDDDGEHASWAPVDLTAVLEGTYEPEQPTLMPRTDGRQLLYAGRVHSFHGESESGKSLVAQAEAARLLGHGLDVLFIDFESDHAAVTGRLLELGATKAALRHHFTYVRPEVDPRRFAHEQAAASVLLGKPYSLAVIDGVTDALGVFGHSSKDNDDITAFMRLLPRTVARLTGAAVVLIDHVTKDSESRGRFAIGGQAKMAALDGAAYVVEVLEALGQGKRGTLTLRVAKDRPGGVRAHAGPFRKTDRTQEAARVTVDSTKPDGLIHVTVGQPVDSEHAAEFRPTRVMEKVSEFIEHADEEVSGKVIEDALGGNRATVRQAVAFLVRDHFVRVESGPRGAKLHVSIQPYRESRDPLSDAYVPAPSTLTSPTSPDLAPTSPGRGQSDLAQPPAPPTGRGEVKGARSTTPPRPTDLGEVVACRGCHRPTPYSETTDDRCAKCAPAPEEDA